MVGTPVVAGNIDDTFVVCSRVDISTNIVLPEFLVLSVKTVV